MMEKKRHLTNQSNITSQEEMITKFQEFKQQVAALSTPRFNYSSTLQWKHTTVNYTGTKDFVCIVWDSHEVTRLHTVTCVEEKLQNTTRKESLKKFSLDCIADKGQPELIQIMCSLRINQIDTLLSKFHPSDSITAAISTPRNDHGFNGADSDCLSEAKSVGLAQI